MGIYIITLIRNTQATIGNVIATISECFYKTKESWKLGINSVIIEIQEKI